MVFLYYKGRYFIQNIEEESNIEENYENFIQVLNDQQVLNDHHEFKELLYLINDIANNRKRTNNFYNKIERILERMKNKILKTFKKTEIFELFKDNKRLLLFLIEEKIITIDEYIVTRITSDEFVKNKYSEYFSPEIKQIITGEFIEKYRKKFFCLNNKDLIKEIRKEHEEYFYDKRKEGENDSHLCEIIRKQQTKEFIVHVNRTNLPLESYIETSIFETNDILMNSYKNIKVIEYAAFAISCFI